MGKDLDRVSPQLSSERVMAVADARARKKEPAQEQVRNEGWNQGEDGGFA